MLARYSLPALATSLVWMHLPQKLPDAASARKRFAFEEVLALQLAAQKNKSEAMQEHALPVAVDRRVLSDFVASFPFHRPKRRPRAIESVITDFEASHPMRRLLEGDVGSGKTAVAAATAYLVASSRPPVKGAVGAAGILKRREAGHLQVAYMCPTEILAKQHFSTFVSYFKDHPIPIGS